MKKIKGIWIVLAVIVILLIGQNLFAIFPFQPAVNKVVGSGGGYCAQDYTSLVITDVVTLQNFNVKDNYLVFSSCADSTQGNLCTPFSYTCSGTPRIISGPPACWFSETCCYMVCTIYACCANTCCERSSCVEYASFYDANGCLVSNKTCLVPVGTCNFNAVTLFQWCNQEQKNLTFGGSKYTSTSGCAIDFDIVLPNGTIISQYNWHGGESVDVDYAVISWNAGQYVGSYCYCVGLNVVPKNLNIEVYYDEIPPQIYINDVQKITAHVITNINIYNGTIYGHWEYLTPFGWKSEPFSIFKILAKNIDNVLEIDVPTFQATTILFSLDSINVTWDVQGATNIGIRGYSQSFNFPTNSVTIYEKIACISDSDCPSVRCSNGRITPVSCIDNICHYTDCPPSTPGGTFDWDLLSDIWNNFIMWIKGMLGWT